MMSLISGCTIQLQRVLFYNIINNYYFTETWYDKMLTYRDWFLEQESVKADETKRPGKPKTYDDLFGMEGSFKQLSID